MRARPTRMFVVPSLAVVMTAAVAVGAPAPGGPPTRPAGKPAAVPAAVAAANRFVDENTFLVAHVDVPAVDPDALSAWVLTILKAGGSPREDVDGMAYALGQLVPPARNWANDFAKAGGRSLFVVASADAKAPVLVIVPVDQRSNPAALGTLMMSPLGFPLPKGAPGGATRPAGGAAPAAAGGYYVERLGDALVLGTEPALRKGRDISLRADRPARPELTRGLTDSGGGSIRAAVAMTAELREALKQIGPNLPAELGGEPTAVLTEKLKWAALSVHTPVRGKAEMTVRLTAQGADADAAGRLKNVLVAAFRTAVNDGDLGKHPDKDKVLAMLDPKVQGDTVEVMLTQAELTKSASILGPLAAKARREAAKSQSEQRMKLILSALRNYAGEFAGRLPANLEDPQLLKYFGNTPAQARETLVNPLNPGRVPGYVYTRPAGNVLQMANGLETVLIYEAADKWPADGVRVGLADGRVVVVTDEAALKRMLGRK